MRKINSRNLTKHDIEGSQREIKVINIWGSLGRPGRETADRGNETESEASRWVSFGEVLHNLVPVMSVGGQTLSLEHKSSLRKIPFPGCTIVSAK